MLSYCQCLLRWLKRPSVVHALRMISIASSKRSQRRMRALQRLGLDHDVVVLPVLAAMAEATLGGPRLADDLHRLVEALAGLVDRDAEAVELGLAVALADAEIDPAAGEQVE